MAGQRAPRRSVDLHGSRPDRSPATAVVSPRSDVRFSPRGVRCAPTIHLLRHASADAPGGTQRIRHLIRPGATSGDLNDVRASRPLGTEPGSVRPGYQPEIQGLRAIAIASVLLFHVGLRGFQGGYLGVDVFFVISGYLISRLIVTEITGTRRFDFKRFYLRRARRLLPALFATLAASALVAAAMLTPEDLARFGRSLAAAALSVSNVLFWRESGYFDVDAAFKPLLHTWSLGVEEQFYVVWPLLLVLVMRRRRWALGIIAAVGLGSFVLNALWLDAGVGITGDPVAAVFYLMPFRIFEFAIGASLLWLIPRIRPRAWLADALLLLALAAIVVPVVVYDEATQFPYWAALPPCLGTAVAILVITTSRLAPVLLANRAAVGLGLISYSVYLVHWPLVVFMRYADLQPLSGAETAIALVASLGLGAALYWAVEKRFRHRRPGPRPASRGGPLVLGIVAFATVLVGVSMWSSEGWPWRIPGAQRVRTDAQWRTEEDARFCSQPDPAKPKALFTCQHWQGKARDVIVWGDSHALHLVGGIVAVYPDANVSVVFANGCVPQSGSGGYTQTFPTASQTRECVNRNRQTLAFLARYRPSTVILTSAKRGRPEELARVTDGLMRTLRREGHVPVFLGDFIRPGRRILGCRSVPRLLITAGSLERRCAPDLDQIRGELSYSRRVAAVSSVFIDPSAVQCPNGPCQFFDGTGALFRDDHHLTWHGAQYFLAKLRPRLPIGPGVRR